jgi:hypothetical protein
MVKCNAKSVVFGVHCQLKKGHKGFHEHVEKARWGGKK